MENDATVCACLSCFWIGIAPELAAEACPECDGRVAEFGSNEFLNRMQVRRAEFTQMGTVLKALMSRAPLVADCAVDPADGAQHSTTTRDDSASSARVTREGKPLE